MTTTKPKTYEQALHELETIIQKMENNETPIDTLAAQLKQAQELITYCKTKLLAAETEVEALTQKA